MKNNIWIKDKKQNIIYFGSLDTQLIGTNDYNLVEATEEEVQESLLEKSRQKKINFFADQKKQNENFNNLILDLVAELVLDIADKITLQDKEKVNILRGLCSKRIEIVSQFTNKVEEIKKASSEEELEKITWNFE